MNLFGDKKREKLAKMKLFNINPKLVFRNSKSILAVNPREKADDVVDYPDFEFNHYYWIYINNVIVVYDVLDEEKRY